MQLWATWAHMFFVTPPDPEVVGETWKDRWIERLENVSPVIETWLSHQRRDEYWRHGSVGEDIDAIECPLLLVGGWEDGYRDAILRMLAARPEQTWAVDRTVGARLAAAGPRPVRTSTGSTSRCAGGGGGSTTTVTALDEMPPVDARTCRTRADRRAPRSTGRAGGCRARRARSRRTRSRSTARPRDRRGRRAPSPVTPRKACTRRSGVRRELPTTSHSTSGTKTRSSACIEWELADDVALLGRPVARLALRRRPAAGAGGRPALRCRAGRVVDPRRHGCRSTPSTDGTR